MILDVSLVNTQQYKVQIKNKDKAWCLPLHLGIVAIKKGTFASTTSTVTQLTKHTHTHTHTHIYIYIYI